MFTFGAIVQHPTKETHVSFKLPSAFPRGLEFYNQVKFVAIHVKLTSAPCHSFLSSTFDDVYRYLTLRPVYTEPVRMWYVSN